MNSRQRAVSLGFIALGLLVLLILWMRAQPSNPVALIRVVDPSGKPVAGALIKPDGLRPKKNGGHYLWTENGYAVKPVAVTTNEDGYARVGYPRYVAERLETGEISFAVNHPDFVPDRPFRKVSITPTAGVPWRERLLFWLRPSHHRFRIDPVVLHPGAVLRVAAYSGKPPLILSNFSVNVSGMWAAGTETWKQLPDGSRLTRRLPPGHRMLRLVSTGDTAPVRFSDVLEFDAKAGQTNEFRLELKPGLRLVGTLDDGVPRPVSGGRVNAEVWPEGSKPGPDSLMWPASSEVNSNGDFVLEPLPPGQLEIIGICDGFISVNGPPKPYYLDPA